MIVYTDGSFNLKPKMAGMGAVITTLHKDINIGCFSQKCQDNNIAEVGAIAMALQYIKENNLLNNEKTLTIITDSEYAINRINNRNTGRTTEEQEMLDYIQAFKDSYCHKFYIMHIKGHQPSYDKQHYYNNKADKIACYYKTTGLTQLREEKKRQLISIKNFFLNRQNNA